ncbi:hypothetical protein J6T21_04375 [Candidatus Saccharibacteria bacterium]|nr:hypothetical protein [Candidatus Saccharibacteria bacterium]
MEEKRKKKLENELNVLAADAKVSRALEIIESLNQIKQDEENLSKTRIEKLGFSLKAIEALKKHNLSTLGYLKKVTISHLTDIGLEKSVIEEVRKVLRNMGEEVKYTDRPNYPNSQETYDIMKAKAAAAV